MDSNALWHMAGAPNVFSSDEGFGTVDSERFPVKRPAFAAAVVLAVLFSASAPPLRSPDANGPRIAFSEWTLPNGLRIIVSEDHTVPIAAVAVTYDVGSLNERPGRTGFAHLFEHLMFRGSANVPSGQHGVQVHNVGGDINGTTGKDRTNYYEYLPSSELELALFLEADRMKALTIDRRNLDAEIATVQEERRRGHDNQPYGRAREAVDELAYKNFAYGHSTIGSMEDVGAATVADAKDFFRTYYAPNNAVLTIVGDIDTAVALGHVKKYFGDAPPAPKPEAVDLSETPQKAERRLIIEDPLARVAQLDIVYHIPPSMTPDNDATLALASVFNDSARAPEALVRRTKLALYAMAFVIESRGPGLFRIICRVAPGRSAAEAEAAIDREIERLKNGPIEDWEVEMAGNIARQEFLPPLAGALNRAILLGEYAVCYRDPGLINRRTSMLASVTAGDMKRAARTYLVRANRSIVTTLPRSGEAEARAGR